MYSLFLFSPSLRSANKSEEKRCALFREERESIVVIKKPFFQFLFFPGMGGDGSQLRLLGSGLKMKQICD